MTLPDGARAVVVTASNRAAAGVYADRSGQALAVGLRELGLAVAEPVVLPDDRAQISAVLREAATAGIDLVVTTGGTGCSPTDITPEATRDVVERDAPGLADAIRAYGAPTVPTAVLSRGVAGLVGRTLIVNLPGSTGGVKDGLAVLGPLLPHLISQLRGGDHAD
ncbi:MAG: MogA/MoaB family molybdenum cofactor biosynthesis protein [Geodermatophilaceae bacterium]|nr:MogA/MoaB family molybdenum cofactor biosynthesis protein [Geodermatophilaceae bacterium]MDQ3464895.1 molybdopterin-binding protein [Actinomycetota bacterium]